MKIFIALSLFVAIASAGLIERRPFLELMSEAELEGRITNGEIAGRTQFPYQVGLSLLFEEGSAWCGGTLLNNRWVLTAAHCTDGAKGVTVYLGAWDIKDDSEKGQQRIFSGKDNIFIHDEWNPDTLSNDISMIKMPVEIKFNEYIQPATLPKKTGEYSTYEGDMVYASGWGKETTSSTTVSQFLRFIEVPVMKQSTCSTYYIGMVTSKMICISTKGGKSTCNGDSGGPLVYKDDGVNYVIGATSFGISLGCEIGYPGVFTRVTSYLDWIEKTSGIVNK